MLSGSQPLRSHRCCPSHSSDDHVAGTERIAEAREAYLSVLLTSIHDQASERTGQLLKDARTSLISWEPTLT